jgi:digeranylgeranylglycerophospholipid reductase
MKTDYDVIVVGAGPGGSMAAKTAAKMGLDTLLIEKRQEIGTPVRCAEGVSKNELKDLIELDERWIAADIVGAKIYAPDGTELRMSEERAGSEVGYVLERKIFDRHLARLAAREGAEVIVKTRAFGLERSNGVATLKLMHQGEIFEVSAPIIIGADGVESKVGQWAGINTSLKLNEIESCVQYLMADIDIEPEYCHFYLGNKVAPGGYVWIFPKGEREANVGIGVLASRARRTAKEYLDEFVKRTFPQGSIVEIVVGGVPVKGPIERAVSDNVMLVGDAARHTDPITGGGILNAMKAGIYAGEVAAIAIERKDYSSKTLALYDEKWKATIGKTIGRNLLIKEKFVKFSDNELNKLAHSIAKYEVEEMSVRGLMTRLILKNPKLLWDLKDVFLKAR